MPTNLSSFPEGSKDSFRGLAWNKQVNLSLILQLGHLDGYLEGSMES